MYDTTGYNFGMGDWSPMDGGSYNGDSFCPAGFTSFEKYTCGWVEPVVLDNDTIIDDMQPLSDSPVAYMICNDAYPDEYYLIENRQQKGWDADYPDKGLLITHVDYDEEVWYNNIPNSVISDRDAIKDGLTCGNDHQRMTLFHADNDDDFLASDLYPYYRNDSLTATSQPAATLFHKNSEGTKLMQGAILGIKQNRDGTMSFRYRAGEQQVADAISEVVVPRRGQTIYTLDGRVAGTALKSLRHGIYLIDGKKVVR